MFRFVVLPCFDLCRSNTSMCMTVHKWGRGILLDFIIQFIMYGAYCLILLLFFVS